MSCPSSAATLLPNGGAYAATLRRASSFRRSLEALLDRLHRYPAHSTTNGESAASLASTRAAFSEGSSAQWHDLCAWCRRTVPEVDQAGLKSTRSHVSSSAAALRAPVPDHQHDRELDVRNLRPCDQARDFLPLQIPFLRVLALPAAPLWGAIDQAVFLRPNQYRPQVAELSVDGSVLNARLSPLRPYARGNQSLSAPILPSGRSGPPEPPLNFMVPRTARPSRSIV